MPPGLWPLVKLYPNQLFGVIRLKTNFFLRSLRILCSGPFSKIPLLYFLITFFFVNWHDTTFKVQNIQWRLLQICTDDTIFRAFVSMGLRTRRSWCVKNTEQILYRRYVSSTCYTALTELAQTLRGIRPKQLATRALRRICFWVSFGKGNQLCESRNLNEPCWRIWCEDLLLNSSLDEKLVCVLTYRILEQKPGLSIIIGLQNPWFCCSNPEEDLVQASSKLLRIGG
jgi:hypothetical protein